MGFDVTRVSVDDTATVIFNTGRNRQGWPATNILLKNTDGTTTLYVGGDDEVTDADGFPIAPGELLAVSALGPLDIIYGVTTGATVSVALFTQTP